MGQRSDLHTLLTGLCDHVYFQPPPDFRMEYPCIVYRRDDVLTEHGNNQPYAQFKRYMVTVIDRDPDSPIPDRVGALPLTRFDRFYTADHLNHDVYQIFF